MLGNEVACKKLSACIEPEMAIGDQPARLVVLGRWLIGPRRRKEPGTWQCAFTHDNYVCRRMLLAHRQPGWRLAALAVDELLEALMHRRVEAKLLRVEQPQTFADLHLGVSGTCFLE